MRTLTIMFRELHSVLLEERERWVLWAPVAVGVGIWLYFQLPTALTAGQAGKLLGIWFLGGWVMRRKRWLRTPWLALLLAIAGLTAIAARTEMLAAPVLEQQIRYTEITGQVQEVEPQPEGIKLVLERVSIDRLPEEKTPKLVRISVKKPPEGLAAGQWIKLRGGLYPPPGKAMPGAFDFSRFFYYRQIGAVGYTRSPVDILDASEVEGWERQLIALRTSLMQRILTQLPSAEGTVVAALMMGERSAIPEDVREDMRVAGLAHVLAISGLHLGLVAGIVFFSTRLILVLIPGLAIRYPIKKWAALLALIATFGYLAIAGFPVSAQRAYVMVALFLIAILLDRTVTPMRSLAWAALVILLLQPESILGASFQLSFAATIGIVAFYERYRDPIHRLFSHESLLKRLLSYIMGVAFTSLVAGFATAPFIIHDFNQFATYNLLANLMVSPIVSFWIMPAIVLAFALMPLGLTETGLSLASAGVGVMLDAAAWVHTLPGAFFHIPSLSGWGIASVTFGGLWLCLWQTRWRQLGWLPIVAGMASISLYDLPSVIISSDGKQIAVQDANGQLVMISGGRRNFTADQWLEQTGRQSYLKPDEAQWNADTRLNCDRLGCVYTAHGQRVAWVRHRLALEEDCQLADALLTQFSLPSARCSAPLVIDYMARRQHGAYALWLTKGGMRAEAAEQKARD